ncbi:hypothetical protein PENSPDRAFT_238552 [Peniophora sp. CONT]|nr:hypothetical protein PENSPDRAFT_238552 [Peniophora sp. CONT]
MRRTLRRGARRIFTRKRNNHEPLDEPPVIIDTFSDGGTSPREVLSPLSDAPPPREPSPPLDMVGSSDPSPQVLPPFSELVNDDRRPRVDTAGSDDPQRCEPLPSLGVARVDDPPTPRESLPPGTLGTDDLPSREPTSPSIALDKNDRISRQSSPPSRTFELQDLWISALKEYHETVGTDLLDSNEPVMLGLANCESDVSFIDVIEGAAKRLGKKREGNKASQNLRKVLKPLVHGLRVILEASAETASSLKVPGGKGIFAAVAILLKAAEEVSATFDHMQHLLERLLAHVEWLQVRVRVPLRREARAIAVEALVHILKTLALITATLHKNRPGLFVKALLTKNNGFADLERTLQDLISDQDRMTNADILLDVHQISSDVRSTHATLMDVHGTTSAHLAEARHNEMRRRKNERQQREHAIRMMNMIAILLGQRQAPQATYTAADASHHSSGWTIHQGRRLWRDMRGFNFEEQISTFRGFAVIFGAWTVYSLGAIDNRCDAAAQTVIFVAGNPINGALAMACHFFYLFLLWRHGIPRSPGWAGGIVIVIDVLGINHQLDQEKFATRESTHAYLVQVFHGRPGASYVDQESYGLGDEAHPVIAAEEWSNIVTPGSVLNMSIIVSAPAPQCPYCKAGTSGDESVLDDGRVICSGCGRCFMCQLNSKASSAAPSDTGQTHDDVSDSLNPSSPHESHTAGESTLPRQSAQPASMALFSRIIVKYLYLKWNSPTLERAILVWVLLPSRPRISNPRVPGPAAHLMTIPLTIS